MSEINIYHLIEGAKKAEGTAVMIDVFRAGSCITTYLNNGADYVVACGSLSDTYRLKERGYLLGGERDGVMPEGFDFPNSPSAITCKDFTGKKVAVNTSAGTQGIVNAVNADEILVSTFLNSRATEEYIRRQSPEKVSIVPLGFVTSKARGEAIEDEEYARYLSDRLDGEPTDYEKILQRVREHPSCQRFFDPSNKIFPKEDFDICMRLDAYDFAAKVFKEDGLLVIRKIR